MCAVLAQAWVRALRDVEAYRAQAACYSAVAEEDRVPQDRECPP
jgi:hypothetical protein